MNQPMSILIPPDRLPQVRPVLWPLLERAEAIDGGRCTAEQIFDAISDAQSQLWLVLAGGAVLGCCITAIRNYPNLRACDVELCAGENVADWLHLLTTDVEPWAVQHNCAVMEIHAARPGWQKLLPDYKLRRVELEKHLARTAK